MLAEKREQLKQIPLQQILDGLMVAFRMGTGLFKEEKKTSIRPILSHHREIMLRLIRAIFKGQSHVLLPGAADPPKPL